MKMKWMAAAIGLALLVVVVVILIQTRGTSPQPTQKHEIGVGYLRHPGLVLSLLYIFSSTHLERWHSLSTIGGLRSGSNAV